jgi:hypothetical protein
LTTAAVSTEVILSKARQFAIMASRSIVICPVLMTILLAAQALCGKRKNRAETANLAFQP